MGVGLSYDNEDKGDIGFGVDRLPRVMVSAEKYLTQGFRFIVTLNAFTYGFQEVSGIEVNNTWEYISEGGVNDHELMVGARCTDHPQLTFRRGLMVRSTSNISAAAKLGVFRAMSGVSNSMVRQVALMGLNALDPQESLESGPSLGTIEVFGRDYKLRGLYTFLSLGLVSWKLDNLDANKSDLLIEEITIAHTGLTRVPTTVMPSLGNTIVNSLEDNATKEKEKEHIQKWYEEANKSDEEKEKERATAKTEETQRKNLVIQADQTEAAARKTAVGEAETKRRTAEANKKEKERTEVAARKAAAEKAEEEKKSERNKVEDRVKQTAKNRAKEIEYSSLKADQAIYEIQKKAEKENTERLDRINEFVASADKLTNAKKDVKDVLGDLNNPEISDEESLEKAKELSDKLSKELNDISTLADSRLTEAEAELDAVNAAIAAAEEEIKNAKNKAEEANTALIASRKTLINAHEALNAANKAIEEALSKGESITDEMKTAQTNAQSALETAQNDYKNKDSALKTANQAVRDKENELSPLKTQKAKAEEKHDLAEQLKEVAEELAEQKEKLDDAIEKKESAKAEEEAQESDESQESESETETSGNSGGESTTA